ncbi:MAG TPA: zf-HC2 domain-containing protein [Cellulomonas sp.]|uniref:zf-HC2 domain-containing protein n=1 Tax=Cellulomonas sp. TaxID=40001 RepID=UPI002E2F3A88|nr:zf-HC2 domain-containing protein [Cellulomonas sp.]HEX5334039.1 zf-HC2 domain-containing protein [Cellulomonas sp.]
MNPLVHRRLRSMVAAFIDGELDEPTARAVRDHLRGCWWCSADAQTHRLVRASLRRRRGGPPSLPVARLRRFARGLDRA